MSDAANHLRAAIQLLRQSPEQALAADAADVALHLLETHTTFGPAGAPGQRDAAGLSIPRVAKLARLSEKTIKNVEAGRNTPTADTMTRIPESSGAPYACRAGRAYSRRRGAK